MMRRALTWKTRIIHEGKCWRSNYFATFTYSDEHLPPLEVGLRRSDFSEFMDGLRDRLDGDITVLKRVRKGRRPNFTYTEEPVAPIRYFMCGEYGETTLRPHYHAVLFNLKFPDARRWGDKVRSEICEELWGRGQVELAPLNSARAAYVAGYVVEKAKRRVAVVNRGTGEYWDRTPEFQGMSTRPGLGAYHLARFAGDFSRTDRAVVDGKEVPLPRYYFEKIKVAAPEEAERILEARIERARAFDKRQETPERLAVREEAERLRHEALSRRGL